MNYADEPYVRLYINDTVSWSMLGWEGRCVLLLLLKGKFDRAGVFDHGCHTVSRAVTAVTGLPDDVAERGVEQLLESGTLEAGDGCLLWPNYIEAQTTTKTANSRKREERTRKRDAKRLSQRVTRGHAESREVTKCHSETEAETEAEIPPTPAGVTRAPRDRKTRATRLAEDWQPTEQIRGWCREQGLTNQQIAAERDGFVDYWLGEGKAKADWQRTFRNRIRSGIESGRIRVGAKPGGGPATDQASLVPPADATEDELATGSWRKRAREAARANS